MADFWDIHRFDPSMDDKKGTSLVIVNNEKGAKMIERIKANTKLLEKAPLEHAIQYNRQIKYSSLLHGGRKKLLRLVKRSKFENAVNIAMENRKFDIGYIGWWYGKNWGSMMTCYAINRVLTDLGKSVLMLPFPSMHVAGNNKQGAFVRTIAERFYDEGANSTLADYHMFNDICDTFLVGSDQLWNWWSNRDVGSYYYFCDFVADSHKKIAYSTSFGHEDAYYPDDMKIKIAYLLNRFDNISVREESAIGILEEYGVSSVKTLDPVFLCSLDAYKEMTDLSKIKFDERFVLGYFLNPDETKIRSIKLTAEKLNLPYKIIVDGQDDFEKLKREAGNDNNIIKLGKVEDWLAHFSAADHIITDSFHGFCYSIIFSKEMTIFPNQLRGLTRFKSVADMVGLDGRFVFSLEEVEKAELWSKKINYKKVKKLLKPHYDYSMNWLKEALDAPKKKPTFQELILKKLANP